MESFNWKKDKYLKLNNSVEGLTSKVEMTGEKLVNWKTDK